MTEQEAFAALGLEDPVAYEARRRGEGATVRLGRTTAMLVKATLCALSGKKVLITSFDRGYSRDLAQQCRELARRLDPEKEVSITSAGRHDYSDKRIKWDQLWQFDDHYRHPARMW